MNTRACQAHLFAIALCFSAGVRLCSAQDVSRLNATSYTILNNNTWVGSPVSVSGLPSDAYVTGIDVQFTVQHPSAPDLRIQLADGGLTQIVEFMTPPFGGPLDQSWTGLLDFNGLPVNGTWVLWVRDEYTAWASLSTFGSGSTSRARPVRMSGIPG